MDLFGADPLDLDMVSGNTAVQAPLLYPYYPKQLKGLLGGIKSAAEYEVLLAKGYPQFDKPNMKVALKRWGPQTIAHLLIIALIIFGNIMFFIDKKEDHNLGALYE